MLPNYLFFGLLIVTVLLIVQFVIDNYPKKVAETFTSSLDYSNFANFPGIYLGSDPDYGYSDYWNYSYPYDVNRRARFKNIIKRFGSPKYYTLFQVAEKQYQYSQINKYLDQLSE